MFNQLTLREITDIWPQLEYFILEAVGTGELLRDKDRANNVLASLLLEDMTCWVSYMDLTDLPEGESGRIMGIVVTSIRNTVIDGERQLLVYAAIGFVPEAALAAKYELYRMEMWTTLVKYAQAAGCKAIVTYSAAPTVIDAFKLLGANVDTRYIYKEV